jgi:hypothetical protein
MRLRRWRLWHRLLANYMYTYYMYSIQYCIVWSQPIWRGYIQLTFVQHTHGHTTVFNSTSIQPLFMSIYAVILRGKWALLDAPNMFWPHGKQIFVRGKCLPQKGEQLESWTSLAVELKYIDYHIVETFFSCQTPFEMRGESGMTNVRGSILTSGWNEHLKGQCHEMVVEVRPWSGRLGLN